MYIITLQILPGLLLCFAMRYDHAVMRATMATDRISLACSKWSYFQISICGYALGMQQTVCNSILPLLSTGLIFAAVAAEMFSSPQPALLYLVPCTLIPFVVKATIQVPDALTCISGLYMSTRNYKIM